MSMIIVCQSVNDLRRYGLKSIHEVGFSNARKVTSDLEFSGEIWSNDTFGILYDETRTSMNSYQQNQNRIHISKTKTL